MILESSYQSQSQGVAGRRPLALGKKTQAEEGGAHCGWPEETAARHIFQGLE